MWEFKRANFDDYRTELSQTNWDACLETDDINITCDTWTEMFLEISKRKIPNKLVTVRPHDKTWYNNYLRTLRRSKDRKYCHAAKNPNPHNWTRYKNAKKHYFLECSRTKNNYEDHIFANLASNIHSNPKKWWELASAAMGTPKNSSYPAMIKDNVIYSSDREKCELFNQSYLESSDMADDEYDLPHHDYTMDHDTLEDIYVLESDVREVIKKVNVNKAYGPDEISPRLVKEAGESIIPILTKIFNKSLTLAKFPLHGRGQMSYQSIRKRRPFLPSTTDLSPY
jgi:hypothetical protein